jgi:hypothetical protein
MRHLEIYHEPPPVRWVPYKEGSKPSRKGDYLVVVQGTHRAQVAYFEGSEFIERITAKIDGALDATVLYFCPSKIDVPRVTP